jgi:hypothetical protein
MSPANEDTLDSGVAIGIDQSTQTRDGSFLFLAGAFIGVAGAALVAASTEALRAAG